MSDTTTFEEYEDDTRMSAIEQKKHIITYSGHDENDKPTKIESTKGLTQQKLTIDPADPDYDPDIEIWEVYHPNEPDKRICQKHKVVNDIVTEIYDERDLTKKTVITYEPGTNILSSVTDISGNTTELNFDKDTYNVSKVSVKNSDEHNQIKYTSDLITCLSSPKETYDFETYSKEPGGEYKSKQVVKTGGNVYLTKKQVDDKTQTAEYSSGEQLVTTADSSKVKLEYINAYNKKQKLLTLLYNKNGELETYSDHLDRTTTNYVYDINGNVIASENEQLKTSISASINKGSQRLTKTTYDLKALALTQSYSYNYDNNDKLSSITLPNNASFIVKTDKLGRTEELGTTANKQKFVYLNGNDNIAGSETTKYTTNYVSEIKDGFDNTLYAYAYDDRGNISGYSCDAFNAEYEYDELNRLSKEVSGGTEYKYTYDTNGNILTKEDLTNNKVKLYTYSGNDKLSNFDDGEFEYDSLGNPVVYRNKKLKWSHLRHLRSFDGIKFEYNASGIRTRKIKGERETKYYYAGGKLLAESRYIEHNDFPDDIDEGYSSKTPLCDIQYMYGINGITGFY